jgi:hypothetical protein
MYARVLVSVPSLEPPLDGSTRGGIELIAIPR